MIQNDTAGRYIAQVARLTEGYVLLLEDGRSLAHTSSKALAAGLRKELDAPPPPAPEPTPPTASPMSGAQMVQAYNLGHLCESLTRGSLTVADFNQGVQSYCPDIREEEWARHAILGALQAAPPPNLSAEALPTPTFRPPERPSAAVHPHHCAYCGRDSDCVVEGPDGQALRAGVEAPCARCQQCFDDECPGPEGTPTPADDLGVEGADGPPPVPERDEEFAVELPRYIVNAQGQRIGTVGGDIGTD